MMRWRGFYVRGSYALVALVLVLSLALAGCGKLVLGGAEKAIENATGGKVNVNQNTGGVTINTGQGTLQMGGTNQWPSQMPPDVPKFSYGKITLVASKTVPGTGPGTGQGIAVTIDNVATDAFDKYQRDLKNAGWTIGAATQNTGGFMISAAKGKRAILATFTPSSDNKFSGMLTYIEGQ